MDLISHKHVFESLFTTCETDGTMTTENKTAPSCRNDTTSGNKAVTTTHSVKDVDKLSVKSCGHHLLQTLASQAVDIPQRMMHKFESLVTSVNILPQVGYSMANLINKVSLILISL